MTHLDELKEENAALKRELGLQRDADRAGKLAARWGLTSKEADLVTALHRRRGAVITKDGLMDALYHGAADEPEIKIVDVFVCKIRRKMGNDAINTHWGRGYAMAGKMVAECDQLLDLPTRDIVRVVPGPPVRTTPHGDVLLALLRSLQTPATASEAAKYSGDKPHNVRARIDYMLRRGLVAHVDETIGYNGRIVKVYATTPAGVRKLAEAGQ